MTRGQLSDFAKSGSVAIPNFYDFKFYYEFRRHVATAKGATQERGAVPRWLAWKRRITSNGLYDEYSRNIKNRKLSFGQDFR
jgi:uncharacterized protein (UPF0261 family)